MTWKKKARTFHTTPFTDETRSTVVDLTLMERKQMVDTMHIDHPAFEEGLEFLRDAQFPVGGELAGGGDMSMLVGDFRSGKTRIVERYLHEKQDLIEQGSTPILHVECTSNWTAKHVMIDILEQLTSIRESDKPGVGIIAKNAAEVMSTFGVELLVVDDAGHVIQKGARHASDLLTNLRKWQTDGLCNVVLVGSADIHKSIEKGHTYIGCLPNHCVAGMDWHNGGNEDYVLFLDAFDDLLPFPRKSHLGAARRAPYFYDLSRGSPALTGLHIRMAARFALKEGAERIEQRHLVKMGVKARSPKDRFTPFVDALNDDMVGRRKIET